MVQLVSDKVFYKIITHDYKTSPNHKNVYTLNYERTSYCENLFATTEMCEALKYGRNLFGKPQNSKNKFILVKVVASSYELVFNRSTKKGEIYLINDCYIKKVLNIDGLIYSMTEHEIDISLEGCIFSEKSLCHNIDKISQKSLKSRFRYPTYSKEFIELLKIKKVSLNAE